MHVLERETMCVQGRAPHRAPGMHVEVQVSFKAAMDKERARVAKDVGLYVACICVPVHPKSY